MHKSDHGCLRGTDQIAKLFISDFVEAEFVAELQLAELTRSCPDGDDEPSAALYAVRAAVAEILGRGHGGLEQGWIVAGLLCMSVMSG